MADTGQQSRKVAYTVGLQLEVTGDRDLESTGLPTVAELLDRLGQTDRVRVVEVRVERGAKAVGAARVPSVHPTSPFGQLLSNAVSHSVARLGDDPPGDDDPAAAPDDGPDPADPAADPDRPGIVGPIVRPF